MDPLYDGDQRGRNNRKNNRRNQREDENDEDEDYSSEEEEENLTFMQKLGSFLFFGCGGGSKR